MRHPGSTHENPPGLQTNEVAVMAKRVQRAALRPEPRVSRPQASAGAFACDTETRLPGLAQHPLLLPVRQGLTHRQLLGMAHSDLE